MTRDYSKFLPPETNNGKPKSTKINTLGWQSHFAQQVDIDDLSQTPPVRVVEVHRNAFHVIGDTIDQMVAPCPDATVGDWLLMNMDDQQSSHVLDRKSILKRRAPGTEHVMQLIAANIDTAFIVSSCNPDFNVARLERYIALVLEADIAPVIVLTKADMATDAETYLNDARGISELVPVVLVDARGTEPVSKLAKWCSPGKTVAFLGSSGVGKSTLTNALIGNHSVATQGIREDDAKGRHTTTTRKLHIVPNGCLVVDTPGMRELQMTETAAGIDHLFADLHALTTQCKFRNCQHVSEPGCAVLKAIKNGTIDVARHDRWRKLLAEEGSKTANVAQRKTKDKALGKTIRSIQKQNKKKN